MAIGLRITGIALEESEEREARKLETINRHPRFEATLMGEERRNQS